MNAIKEERTILAFKLYSKLKADQGNIRSVAEIIDGKLIELNATNFCHTNKVFVTTGYQIIDEKFKKGQIFRSFVKQSDYISENIDPSDASKYLTQGIKTERLKPSELIEIIDGELPNRNKRYFETNLTPSTEYIFIRNKLGDCFGPFAWEYKEDESGFYLELLNDKPLLNSYPLSLGQLFKIKPENFSKFAVSFSIEERDYHFIYLNFYDFISEADHYEYASDEEIVRYCTKLASEMGASSLNKANWNSFKELANNNANFNSAINKSRLLRLAEMANEFEAEQDEICDNIDIFLKGHYGDKIVSDFIINKRPQLLERLRKEIIADKDSEIENKKEEAFRLEQQLREKNKQVKELSAEVERKRKEASKEVILEHAIAQRNENIKKLDQEILEKEKQLNKITERLNLSTELDDINKEIDDRKVISKHYEKENSSLQKITEKLEAECKEKEDDLRIKLTLLKPYIEAVNGSFILDKREKRAVFVDVKTIDNADSFDQQRLVVETVKNNLRLKGRYFESWQVANLLVSTQQSFITFLAGLPGVGKTSLARLIAEAQQLEPRLQEVSVARGWTTQKDLIGFYNPLSNRFQSSNTGLYDFIDALSLEKKDEQAMAYILLDEANLSPIEHYWSAFMAMADGEGERLLRLGQETLAVPDALRFLATINYDGTTEPLSPRVVDRAPVLVMETNNVLLENADLSVEKEIALPLSALEMNKLFGVLKNTPAFQDDEAVIFNEVRKILSDPSLEKGRPLSISQRKEIVIRQYCAQASSLMRSFGCDDFKALDLAILQHVLPQVRGNGQKFAKRLTELKQTCDNVGLKDSAAYLAKMLAYGETELHSYDFFCW